MLQQCAATLANVAEDKRNMVQLPKDGAFQCLVLMANLDMTMVDLDGDGSPDGRGDGGSLLRFWWRGDTKGEREDGRGGETEVRYY
jgi:hypothetical protein